MPWYMAFMVARADAARQPPASGLFILLLDEMGTL